MSKMHSKPRQEPALGSSRGKTIAKSRSQKKDDSIMGTNNSSIVSKRSVERIYFPNEPHFFRYFVKKPQRRSPLINRGYWLRMKAIDTVVHHFLDQPCNQKKIVINLGCGYDPLPWQCLYRYPAACEGVTFVDIDYKDLMLKKRNVVQATPELNSLLTNTEFGEGDILFRSDQYVQVSCDLRDLAGLNRVLGTMFDLEKCFVLLTAEVSITYMNVEASDGLIGWASKLPQARFCILEQILPDGIDQPFSKAMMAHFDKIQTPLGAVKKYPTTTAQRKRFRDLGWLSESICNLWEMWSLPSFVTPSEKAHLDNLEPFDEWEEFAIYACHYFLLVADTSSKTPYPQFGAPPGQDATSSLSPPTETIQGLDAAFAEFPKGHGCRRFAAAIPIRRQNGMQDPIGIFGGMGLNTRTNTCDVYTNSLSRSTASSAAISKEAPSPRMCHTVTNLGESGALLVGGRTSPDQGLVDCWIYHKWVDIWERVEDLPHPLYRHQAVNLGHGYVVVSTGRINSHKLSQELLLWSRSSGWTICSYSDESPIPTYGAVFTASVETSNQAIPSPRTGILAGGMSSDAVFQQDIWQWKITGLSTENVSIKFERSVKFKEFPTLARFGANVVNLQGQTYLVGGVVRDQLLDLTKEICVLDVESGSLSVVPIKFEEGVRRPLLIGATAVASNDCLFITGGSAVCFSFGTFWNNGCYTLRIADQSNAELSPEKTWKYSHTIAPSVPTGLLHSLAPQIPVEEALVALPRFRITSSESFKKILQAGKPVILEKSDIGPCSTKWTREYLKAQVGFDRKVVVHQADEKHMDFKAKNFKYSTIKFGDFLDQIDSGEKLYLRSLSSEKPAELPTRIEIDYPTIAQDFQIPPELAFVSENIHSLPLRISGPVNMWLHYDVMANIYCQIQGSKRLILFPPSDVVHLGFEPGSSTSRLNIFEKLKDTTLSYTHPHSADLQPGDILYLPPLWLHATSPTSQTSSIAINIFFRNLETGYAAGKDVYGNRDLQAYEKGRMDVGKIVRSFEGLPGEVRSFYLRRLVEEFEGLV